MVLPDATEAEASRVVRESGAGVVAHGHIHTPYQRRLPEGVLLCVGAVGGCNDQDPRPAYSILEFSDDAFFVEVRRVEVSVESRVAEREAAGWTVTHADIKRLTEGGPFPVRSKPGERVSV